jgi:hypothetical protein
MKAHSTIDPYRREVCVLGSAYDGSQANGTRLLCECVYQLPSDPAPLVGSGHIQLPYP